MIKKASLLLTMALVLLLLSACGGTPAEDAPFEWPENPNVEQKNDSLAVLCMDGLKDSMMIKLAVQLYQRQYPDVNVTLTMPGSINDTEPYEQVAAEIMSGEGPDVFIINDNVMDVEKLVRQGIFADMESFFTADGFDWEPYNQAVMNGGVWDGRRYVIPLSYDFPLLFTSRTALEETGFDVDACGDFSGFMKETLRYMEDPAQTRQLFRGSLGLVNHFTKFAGIQIASYNTQTVDLSSSDLKAGYQWAKTTAEKNPNYYNDFSGDTELYGAAAIRDGAVLWSRPLQGPLSGFYNEYGAIQTFDEAVMMPVRDLDGGIQAAIRCPAAVRANSENLQNAYDFIKILLSEEVQGAYNADELSVLDTVNYAAFQEISQGHAYHIRAGTNGFVSTANETDAIDWPAAEAFEEFMGYAHEISGTYYASHLGLSGEMYPFVYEGADYDETLKEAKRAIELYLSE